MSQLLQSQLSSLEWELEDTELLWRVHLLTDVVLSSFTEEGQLGNDWVITEEIKKVRLDASVLGLSIPMLLSKWLEGTYRNKVLDGYKYWVMKGIDWLLTGDRAYLESIKIGRLEEVNRLIENTFKVYLEDLYLSV